MFCLSKRQRKIRADNEDNAPLCSTCSALHLRTILHDGVPQEHPIPLGHLTDILNKYDQCGLCRLLATAIRQTWLLDKMPGIDLTGITCALYAERCGYPKIQNKTLPVLRD